LAQLEELQGKKLIEKSQEKEHYLMLTEIIKQYFSKIFHEKMLELTTQEVLTILEPKIDQQLFRKIKKVFLASDEVKFAKKILTEDEHKEIFEKLKSIIEKTSTTGA